MTPEQWHGMRFPDGPQTGLTVADALLQLRVRQSVLLVAPCGAQRRFGSCQACCEDALALDAASIALDCAQAASSDERIDERAKAAVA